MRKILPTGLGVALAASLSLSGSIPGIAASAQAGTAGWFTVSGTVTGASGPVRVWLYAWPSAAVVRSLRPGQKVPLTVLGEQATSTGRYAIGVSPGAVAGRIVNMEVAAFGGGAMTARSFTRWRVAGAGGPVLAMPFGPARMAPQVANMRLIPAAPADPCPLGGSLHYQRNLGAKNVVVGATYSKAPNVTAGFSYYSGQSSSLGVGLSISTGDVDYSQSGTYSISSNATETFPSFHGVGSHYHVTQFRYGLFRWFCVGPRGGGYWANYQTQPADFAGGTSQPGTSPNFRTPYCQHFIAGSLFILNRTAAYTFRSGVSIHDDIGINLSSETGYDSGAALSYTITGRTGRWICGVRNNPGGVHPPPGLLVVH